ncbi:hypothetical protein OG455_30660 [Kitasatospora sp. NBC_01287]|uniref:hypothetical protein n=1 Tax=Kitasatospora sp. NBC_01287 TaxID=2903573 RepID=UPI00225436B7|nr:hypothetical protein [Kitasatospora sp. NBC_01287]MCX4749827.1 hypothetical protein [Kitasatospora sp. NBC_01287]
MAHSVILKAWKGLHATATLEDDGKLRFEGHDYNGATDFEYYITVSAADVPKVAAALGAGSDEELMAALEREGAAITQRGEYTWLRSLDLTPDLWSHRDW